MWNKKFKEEISAQELFCQSRVYVDAKHWIILTEFVFRFTRFRLPYLHVRFINFVRTEQISQ